MPKLPASCSVPAYRRLFSLYSFSVTGHQFHGSAAFSLINRRGILPLLLFSDLTVSENDIFRRGQSLKPHRTSGMELLCADSDLRAESELESVGKSC